MAKILVYAEQRNHEIKKVAYENITLARTLAREMGNAEIISVIIGAGDLSPLSQDLARFGAEKIFAYTHSDLTRYNGQGYAKILAAAISEHGAEIVIMGATAMGKDLAPRVGARLKSAVATDCIALNWVDEDLEIVRPIYAGKIRATIRIKSEIKILTVRPNVVVPMEEPVDPQFTKVDAEPGEMNSKTTDIIMGDTEKLDVTEADIIVSGGRGMKGPENFHLIESLAKKLGAAQGASRAVVDAGWRPYAEQVGQTGKTVSPSLYIAVGISGAIQHLAGMSSSKFIVAINKDPEAPIFKIADYGIVGDAFEILPKLIESLK